MTHVKSSRNAALEEMLRGKILASGSLSFSEWMRICLYEPELGYYASGQAEIGKAGDFYTSVSVGGLFGELMARQFVEAAVLFSGTFVLCEQGANNGTFAADVLAWMKCHHQETYERTTYRLIEPVELLREDQKETLGKAGVLERCEWRGKMEKMEGVFFSNELIDAFPVDLLIWREGRWLERRVGLKDGGFVWQEEDPQAGDLLKYAENLPSGSEGYCVEVNREARPWIRTLAENLVKGVVMTVDYGFRRDLEEELVPERADGTLACYAQHTRGDDPLSHAGEQDLTAHVNFSELIQWGEAAGLKTEGYTDQHHALVGIAQRYFMNGMEEKNIRLFKQLMHPTLMGTQFKFLVQSKNIPNLKLSCLEFARG